jgi:hypothetical protein
MKTVETKTQHNMLMEELKVLYIPSMKAFDDDWYLLQKFLEKKGYPPYTIGGNLDLHNAKIKSLGNLQSVGGYLDLYDSKLESLGNLLSVGGNLYLEGTKIESLGNLQSVGFSLELQYSKIKSLGNLQSVGFSLDLQKTPISKKYSKEEIRQMVRVGSTIYI